MRQNLYTCCRCGCEQRTSRECDSAPGGWAIVTFRREHNVENANSLDTGVSQSTLTTLTTHTCSDCCAEVLAFLETAVDAAVDLALDEGGAT